MARVLICALHKLDAWGIAEVIKKMGIVDVRTVNLIPNQDDVDPSIGFVVMVFD